MKEYVYKIVHKYIKNPALLEKFGFHLYSEEAEENIAEVVMARPIQISQDSDVFKSSVNLIEYLYKQAEENEKLEDFKEYHITKSGKMSLKTLSKKTLDSLTKCQLCFYLSGTGAYQLFINAPDNGQYFNSKVLDQTIGETVEELLKAGVIYKKKIN